MRHPALRPARQRDAIVFFMLFLLGLRVNLAMTFWISNQNRAKWRSVERAVGAVFQVQDFIHTIVVFLVSVRIQG